MKHDHQPDEVDLPAALRAAGFRATRPRLAVLEHLAATMQPESILDIAAALAPAVNQVSVYRIIEAFKQSGLIREVNLQDGRPRYELADPHDHHHVVCLTCGKVEDFTGCESERLAKTALRQASGFGRIVSHSFEFFGYCNACLKQNKLATI